MRERLSEESLNKINLLLPDLPEDWLELTFQELSPFLFEDLDSGGTTHISLVCLADGFKRCQSSRLCVFEAIACIQWHRNESPEIDPKSKETLAAYYGKFFSDYNFLFLYAIGEDIAEFALKYLTKDVEFETWKKQAQIKRLLNSKRVSSRAAKVGIFLRETIPKHEITRIIVTLGTNSAWKKP